MRLVTSFAFAIGLFGALAAEAAAQGGDGLNGDYYNYSGTVPPQHPPGNMVGETANAITAGPFRRTDAMVDFDWGNGTPMAGPMPGIIAPDNIYVVWTGWLRTTAAGNYQFSEETDDGGHFYIRPYGGAWVPATETATNWGGEAMTIRPIPFAGATNQIMLAANSFYEIRFEMYEGTGGAGARLRWQPPGGAMAVIPQSQLFTNVVIPATPVLTGTAIISGANLDWNDIAGATSYQLFMGTAPGVYNPTPIYTGAVSAYTQTGLSYGVTYYFVVVAVTANGIPSALSNMVTIIPIAPPPRTNSHSEGLLDDNCACGSSIPGPLLPGLAGLAGLAILAATRRRK